MSVLHCSSEVATVSCYPPMVIAHKARGVHVEVVYVVYSANEIVDD